MTRITYTCTHCGHVVHWDTLRTGEREPADVRRDGPCKSKRCRGAVRALRIHVTRIGAAANH